MTFLVVDMAGLDRMLEQLGDKAEEAARPAAQAAAQVLYEEVKRNAAAIQHKTGNLERSIYQAYWNKQSGPGYATYRVSWNHQKAPHGQLVEFGHIQRYANYIGKDGKWYTAVRREARGKRKPGRRASQAEKDAYYVSLPAPRQVAAQPFVRPAIVKFPQASEAAAELLQKALE